ncbi:precorrin-3B synthase [Pseudomonas sp. Marseille-QA0892]
MRMLTVNPSSSTHRPVLRRPSACPGLSRIVSAKDGGICRVKLALGRITADQAHAVSGAARRYASGVLEITNRSNLQIRGVWADAGDALAATLIDAGLGPRHPDADDVRNVLVSPSAGRDPYASLDVTALAEALLLLLQEYPAFRGLPAKFAIQVDGGEGMAVRAHEHDIWLSALPGGQRLQIGLAGAVGEGAIGEVASSAAVDTVAHILRCFVATATEDQPRMRHLMASPTAPAFLAAVRADASVTPCGANDVQSSSVQKAPGIYPQRDGTLRMVTAQAPLGRLDADQLDALADVAGIYGSGWLHLTPWQGVLLPDIDEQDAPKVQQALEALGLVTAADAPLAHLVACSGSVGCAKAHADTKADALQLARRLSQYSMHPSVHLSGCPRTCASACSQPYTLLAQPGGQYDLFQHDPSVDGLGQLRASGLDIGAAAHWLCMNHHETFDD